MRISDWSSDVCSSDLLVRLVGVPALALQIGLAMPRLHQTRQREFLRIAEGEVAAAGLATTVGVARVEVEVLDRCHAGRGRDDTVGNGPVGNVAHGALPFSRHPSTPAPVPGGVAPPTRAAAHGTDFD